MRSRAAFAVATVLVCAAAHAQTQEGIAQTRFNKGRELFIAGQFSTALVEFRAASELYESPNSRLYIARCERELGHAATAYVEFERAASEAADRARGDPRYASTRDAAKQEAGALEGKLAHVTVLAPSGLPDGATITVNGGALGAAGLGVAAPIDPGAVDVVAKAPGYLVLHKTARAAAGEAVEIKIQLEKDPSANANANANTNTNANPNANANANATTTVVDDHPRSSHGLRNAGFVVGGIGIAGMGAFAGFAALAQTRFDQLKRECGGPCDASHAAQIDEGQTFQNIANVALAVSGTAIVTGAIMIIAGMSTGNHDTTASIAPLAGGGWYAGVSRAF